MSKCAGLVAMPVGLTLFFFLCLRSGDICGRGHYVIFFFGLTVRPSVRLIFMNTVALEFLEGISSDFPQMST